MGCNYTLGAGNFSESTRARGLEWFGEFVSRQPRMDIDGWKQALGGGSGILTVGSAAQVIE
jgi:hypothetical protein